MATTCDTPSADGHSAGVNGRRRPAAWLAAAAVVVLSGATGWVLAGPPADDAAVVPPPCPPSLRPDGAAPVTAHWLPGEAGRLVPVPLPQPRGPVSVRVCRYRSAPESGYLLHRHVVLDPARTASLAGLLDRAHARTVTGDRPAGCAPGPEPAVLVFRYTQGVPLLVEVPGGACALVATRARSETGRPDVVQAVTELTRETG